MHRVLLLMAALICVSDSASAQSLEGRLKQIGETKVVKLAYRSDANPFSFVNPQGQPDGYTVDLCKFVVPLPRAATRLQADDYVGARRYSKSV
jgi:glutamate/aspartate transport system substrate-binding protein